MHMIGLIFAQEYIVRCSSSLLFATSQINGCLRKKQILLKGGRCNNIVYLCLNILHIQPYILYNTILLYITCNTLSALTIVERSHERLPLRRFLWNSAVDINIAAGQRVRTNWFPRFNWVQTHGWCVHSAQVHMCKNLSVGHIMSMDDLFVGCLRGKERKGCLQPTRSIRSPHVSKGKITKLLAVVLIAAEHTFRVRSATIECTVFFLRKQLGSWHAGNHTLMTSRFHDAAYAASQAIFKPQNFNLLFILRWFSRPRVYDKCRALNGHPPSIVALLFH